VNQTIKILRCEHRNIAILLDLLERQTDLVEKTDEPDLPLIVEIIDYFRSFPDMHHHPKEDIVLRRLRERTEGLDEDFLLGLEDDHDHLSDELYAFSRTVTALMTDPSPMTRSTFILTTRSFIERERQHMAMEEGYFFPAAEHWLTDEDWREIDEAVNQFVDPMSTPHAGYRFRLLTEHLDRWRYTEAA
jgi:hemerythrin-like domain-containing protein